MNSLDFILLIIVCYFVIKGLYNGLIKEVLSLAAIFCGFLAAYFFSAELELLIHKITPDLEYTKPLAYIILFVSIVLIINLLAKLSTKAAKAIALGTINRILGGVFGLIKALLLLGFVWALYRFAIQSFNLEESTLLKGSIFITYLEFVSSILKSFIPALR